MDARGSTIPRRLRELLGVAAAIAIAVLVVAAVAASARSELLFRDGDSLVTTLVVRSIAMGQPQDWALSTVLFLPESAVLGLLTLLGLGVTGTLALAGVVNVVALYGALRVAAGSTARARAPIAGALLGLGGFALLAVTETSASRDSLELASLLTTTTYYSATVLAVVLSVGIARRGLETPVPLRPAVLIGAVAAASVLTNPLYAAWATVSLVVVLGAVALPTKTPAALWLGAGLVAGSLVGFLGRMPLAPLIANSGAGYADPSLWRDSLSYYGALLAERFTTPAGVAAVVGLLLLWGWCVALTVLLGRRGDVPGALVAACGWVMPVLVVVGAIALGTNAARYLQPAAFAPLLGLVLLPEVLPLRAQASPLPRGRAAIAAIAAVGIAFVAAGAAGVPRIAAAASAPDADLACVVDWAEESGRTGAGQFWTVRLPKTHMADPRGLVQVDHELRGYAWLVNRDDFTVGDVTFLVLDDESTPFDLPGSASLDDAELIPCGRYTIADFGERELPLGPQRS